MQSCPYLDQHSRHVLFQLSPFGIRQINKGMALPTYAQKRMEAMVLCLSDGQDQGLGMKWRVLLPATPNQVHIDKFSHWY